MRSQAQEVRNQILAGAVVQRTPRVGRWHGTDPGTIIRRDVLMMEHDAGRDSEPTTPPGSRQCKVDVRWKYVRKPMERQRGLVRDHTGSFRPEPCDDQILVLTRREVDEPVDSSTPPHDPACADVLEEELRRVTGLGCLPGREITFLCAGRLKQ